jgi:hypothetical protein
VHRDGDKFNYLTRRNHDYGERMYDVLNRLFKRRLVRPSASHKALTALSVTAPGDNTE